MTRENAVGRALACYDDDFNEGYYKRLGNLVAVKTESQNPDRLDEHISYVKDHMTPANVTGTIQSELGMPFAWLPMSYLACSQHAPNEHIIKPLMRKGLELITGVYWEMGTEEGGYKP